MYYYYNMKFINNTPLINMKWYMKVMTTIMCYLVYFHDQSESQTFGIQLLLSMIILWQASLARFFLQSCVPLTGHDDDWEQGIYNIIIKKRKQKNCKIFFCYYMSFK